MNNNILLTMNIRKYHSNEDSLEQGYASYFERLGFNSFAIINSENFNCYFENIDVSGVVLTGGIDVNSTDELSGIRNKNESLILEHCINSNIPILGICRGMHLINKFFGGIITPNISNHVRARHKVTSLFSLYGIIPNSEFMVNSYHNHGIKESDLAPSLSIAFLNGEDKIVEGIFHSQHSIMGIQWHPERETEPCVQFDNLIIDFFGRNSV